MRSLSFLAFVALTFCCWGVYGPVLHVGQEMMGADGKLSSLRPFICVGIAYFLIAVVYPATVLKTTGEQGAWSASGFLWSFIAGAIGAIGALGIIMAFKFQGKPVYVMPLVFGLAPIVNTFVTMLMSGTIKQAKPIFFVGIVLVALGAAGVLRFKPTKAKTPAVEPAAAAMSQLPSLRPVALVLQEEDEKPAVGNQEGETAEEKASPKQPRELRPYSIEFTLDAGEPVVDKLNVDDDDDRLQDRMDGDEGNMEAEPGGFQDPPKNGVKEDASSSSKSDPNFWFVAASIGVTALCWGAYGPVLHKGQAKMQGSRLRPFLCVGLAYFAIAVVVPLVLQGQFPEPGGWDIQGTGWSLLAGAAGAVGALGIIYAFNFGGKPIFVMPLVFGFAPVINTLTETFSKNLFDQVSIYFLASLAVVIVGAVIVLVFAPRAAPKPPPSQP